MSYESPIEIICGKMKNQLENDIYNVVQSYGIKVDKGELINALEYDRNQYKQGYADAKAELERKWIPITEKLPENAEFVLLTIRRLDKSYNQTPFISVGYVSWNQSAWWCAHDGDCDMHNVEVLAWMPLPEPWRGE